MLEGKESTVEQLMKLLAQLTGWGNDSLRVTMAYMPAVCYVAEDIRRVDNTDWGFVARASICGSDQEARGEGKTLEAALADLAWSVAHKLDDVRRWYAVHLERASELLEEAKKDGLV